MTLCFGTGFKSLMARVLHSAIRPDGIVPDGVACKLNAHGDSLVPNLEHEIVSRGSISSRQALLCQLHCGTTKWLALKVGMAPADHCCGVQNMSCSAEESTP